ncbi:MAG: DUF1003 domain-containing protein [Candidatus Sungbacteria bacterium]|uniref:DUF1003 domain-containing protein n=1 Tax=Candidatus Sungiibacteriota bacterium TaxID=2750080 RepID=A0A9D6LQ25_9BACT|nr:DUF1003 domain-containing protein [Candidatus Sungbacteria bacterium]
MADEKIFPKSENEVFSRHEARNRAIAKKIADLKSEKFTRLDRVALWVNRAIGSFRFFILLALWTGGWLLWNAFAPPEFRFDPYPAFVLWLFISNMIQLLFLPLLMVGQDLQGRHAELRAEIDFEINRRAEEELHEVLRRLELQQREIKQILKQ